MKPRYERVAIPDGCSVRVYRRRLAQIPFEWHHHPEYELTLTLNSLGKRFVGDHVADYAGDDLVLVPPNLPHTWVSDERLDPGEPLVALVLWFDGDWAQRVADCCPEFAGLRTLLRRAAPGLAFAPAAAADMRARLPALVDRAPRVRLAAALDVLACLADAPATPLATAAAYRAASGAALAPEAERLDRVLDLLDRRFHEPLRVAELAALAHLSERSLQRRFARHVGESIGSYLQRLRLAHAARLLASTDWPVSLVATRSGYANLANFNRQFLAARRVTPRAYRRFLAEHGRAPDDMPAHEASIDVRPPSLDHGPPRTGKNKIAR
ncbi:helix-turn-helix domain protein [Burkholderia pseudomallei MSHR3951]|uniref:helix-turn-helix domain-containing protein n=1 Tax=Burkholderia pseudomallei TaxID=28450 RepID=UPI00050DF262|nr:AraC family transcriptional regulator [Burkholderia pseudomallei]AJX18383.1 helix-turn-helix domain protein [Burkholderia pseudomallei MSHR491]KGC70551.1 helix-turn-helix domain protein [Burkholderia pseudomallei]KGS26527.1 helix-turn-helix domain protein [Burkholderia pseudomallei MSHR4378]KGV65558.1 helix-turn-helix domain protein [Burkholderia pseudomallei MSHR3964]KGV93627.1 helix-turn-helix domain protein [Burkholderia pseudomallei MSHR3960]